MNYQEYKKQLKVEQGKTDEFLSDDSPEFQLTPEQKIYQPYFNIVSNKEHWKKPIDIDLPPETPLADLDLIKKAIQFYTGSVALISHTSGVNAPWNIRAVGYYIAIGA